MKQNNLTFSLQNCHVSFVYSTSQEFSHLQTRTVTTATMSTIVKLLFGACAVIVMLGKCYIEKKENLSVLHGATYCG